MAEHVQSTGTSTSSTSNLIESFINVVELNEMRKMRISEILDGAARLVAGGWCQRAAAQNASGQYVFASSRQAVRFCMAGAVERMCSPNGFALCSMKPALDFLRAFISEDTSTANSAGLISNHNDSESMTQAEAFWTMLDARDKAKELEKNK